MSARISSVSSQVRFLSQSLCTVLTRSKRIPMQCLSILNENDLVTVTGCGVGQYSLSLHYGTDSRVTTHYNAYHFRYAEVQSVNIAPCILLL